MIELIVPPLGLTGLLPEFVGAVDDLIFGWLCHDAFLMKAAPPWGFGEMRRSRAGHGISHSPVNQSEFLKLVPSQYSAADLKNIPGCPFPVRRSHRWLSEWPARLPTR